MLNTMEERTTAQDRINRQRADTLARFPSVWEGILAGWQNQVAQPRVCLMYAANYLFSAGGIQWAMDPVRLRHRLPEAPDLPVARDLQDLSFVLLTHRHSDHLDLELIDSLSDTPITWVIPDTLLSLVLQHTRLKSKQIIVPGPLEPFELEGIRITAFKGLHWEEQPGNAAHCRGVPATGYLLERGGRRWLFPGDTRTYSADQLPSFGPIDALFAHVWLGRGLALLSNPPLLDAFVRFCLDLQPRRIVLTHLNEFGRQAENYWEMSHADRVLVALHRAAPGIPTRAALMGDTITL